VTTPIIDQSAVADKKRTPEIVYGVHAIGEAIDERDPRRVFYKLQKGHIPGAKKMGREWVLSIPAFRRAMHGEFA